MVQPVPPKNVDLVGGFNHLEKYESQLGLLSHILWNNIEHNKCLKPPTSDVSFPGLFTGYHPRLWIMIIPHVLASRSPYKHQPTITKQLYLHIPPYTSIFENTKTPHISVV